MRRSLPVVLALWLVACVQSAAGAAPRNVILLIGDGSGFNHYAAGELYRHGAPGCSPLDSFAVRAAMSTYSAGGSYDPTRAWSDVDWLSRRVTDSAAAITAMTTGVKTRNGRLAVDPQGACLTTLAQAMHAAGKATGVVTTVPFAHATPAGVCVCQEDRNDYVAIARDMLLHSPVDVIMGAGHPFYDDSGRPRATPDFTYVGGQDTWDAVHDGAGGDVDGDGRGDPWTVIETRAEFEALGHGPSPRRLLGIPRVHETLQEQRGGDRDAAPYAVPSNPDVPTLTEMTAAALNVLEADPDGFFVMIEGGAVDWASHDGHPGRLVEEAVDYLAAVQYVCRWVEAHGGWDETLVIATADHETGRLTGPVTSDRIDDWPPVLGCGQGCAPSLVLHSNEHTNELVPFYAQGSGAEAFPRLATGCDPVRGAYLDNTDLGHVLQGLARTTAPARAN